jgi:pyruvate dehydrogenase E2 component (dihydrolipoamide acetyltransferase)
MAIAILMPALSPTMTEGNLAKWLKKEGDKVAPGETIAEIETDKATMEVEAVDEGTLIRILVKEGTEGVSVNQLIAVLIEDGEDHSAAEALIAKHGASPTKATSEAEVIPLPLKAEAPKSCSVQSPSSCNSDRIFASPLARRIASLENIDLTAVEGSGPRGRIVKADVIAAKSSDGSSSRYMPQAFNVGRNAQEFEKVNLSNMRKVIAKRLLESKQTIPHFYLDADCKLDLLLKLREQMNLQAPQTDGKHAYKISVNDFVIKAVSSALRMVPDVNASWANDSILRYNNIDISVAVAIPDGLITPIIKNADQKSLVQISQEVKDLAARAKVSGLKPEEFQGGNFSISNLGMYGVKNFKAIINPPQSCILAVGATEKKPVVNEKGEIVVSTVMSVSISCDHRVVDGAVGAEFLAAFKKCIENPAMMLLV